MENFEKGTANTNEIHNTIRELIDDKLYGENIMKGLEIIKNIQVPENNFHFG